MIVLYFHRNHNFNKFILLLKLERVILKMLKFIFLVILYLH